MILQIDNLHVKYGNVEALHGISIDVREGEIVTILGANGAGKSTTLRMVMNIIARDSGTIALLGADPVTERGVLRRVGYLPEERGLYKKMAVIDLIVFFAALRGMPESDARRQGVTWLEKMGLGQWQKAKVETLSKGMQQKVQFITTVIHGPELLILDEPASGLDPVNQEVLRDTILGARDQGRTVVFSTHNMDQAEQLCDSVCIIATGRKVLDGALKDIRRSYAGHHYRIEFESPGPAAEALIAGSPALAGAERVNDGWHVELPSDAAVRGALSALSSAEVRLSKFEHVRPSLHQIFVEKVGHAEIAARRPEVSRA